MVSYQLTAFISLVVVCACTNPLQFEAPKCAIKSFCSRDNAIVKIVPQKPFNGLIRTDVQSPECKRGFTAKEESILFHVNFKNCTLGSDTFALHVYNPIMLTKDFGFRGPALISHQVICKEMDYNL
ncbi:uncharacterized protein LOC141534278 [Cotesia typhae]|uniref:uncharacterized protein LOC141534278 n=1 Tax=Cotesia typhae TaxID=2053667 RepID=UPI003D682273